MNFITIFLNKPTSPSQTRTQTGLFNQVQIDYKTIVILTITCMGQSLSDNKTFFRFFACFVGFTISSS